MISVNTMYAIPLWHKNVEIQIAILQGDRCVFVKTMLAPLHYKWLLTVTRTCFCFGLFLIVSDSPFIVSDSPFIVSDSPFIVIDSPFIVRFLSPACVGKQLSLWCFY